MASVIHRNDQSALTRPLILSLVAGLSTALLGGCDVPRSGDRLTVASAGRISSLDPAQASTVSAIQLLSALGDPLYSLGQSGELEPRLASAAPIVSDDGLTVTIPLRKDVVFPTTAPRSMPRPWSSACAAFWTSAPSVTWWADALQRSKQHRPMSSSCTSAARPHL